MKREHTLIKNTIILSIGKLLPKALAVVTLPIITASLTKEEFGTYDFLSTLISLFLPIATFQIQSAAFRFLIDFRGNRKKSKIIITNILAFTSFSSIPSVVILYFLLSSHSNLTKILVCIYFLVDILNLTLGQIVRGLSYNIIFSASAIILSFSNAILICITLLHYHLGLDGILLAVTIANFMAILLLFIKAELIKYIDYKLLSLKELKFYLQYSWPLIPNNLSNWILSVSDRIIIVSFLGVGANAIYAAANKIPNLFIIVQNIFIMAWQENASIVAKDKDSTHYFNKMFGSILTIFTGLLALLIACSPLLFHLLIKGNYQQAFYEMPILFLGILFACLASYLGGIYVAFKETRSVGITTLLAALCNIIINLSLIKHIGITAASISTLVSYFSLTVFRMIGIRKIQNIKYNYLQFITYILLLLLMCFICYQKNFLLNIANVCFGFLFAIFINRKILKATLALVIKRVKG